MEVSAHLLGMQRHPVHLLEQGANPERMNVIDMHTVVSPSSALEVLSLPLLMCSCGWRVQEKPTVASSPPQTVPLQRTFLLRPANHASLLSCMQGPTSLFNCANKHAELLVLGDAPRERALCLCVCGVSVSVLSFLHSLILQSGFYM
jgi:hypothetical protein